MIDKYNINPAYAGLDRSLSVNFNYRNQWQGLTNNPESIYVNAHLPIYLFSGGAGIKFMRDKLGAVSTTQFNVSYNYVYPLPRGLFSSALSVGIRQTSIDGRSLRAPDGIYAGGIFSHEDPILLEENMNGIALDWTLGLFIGHDLFDFGLTLSNFTQSSTGLENFTYDQSRHLSLYTQIPLLWNDFEIYPSILAKTNLKSFQSDISVLVKNGNIFGGMSLRGFDEKSFESIIILGGLRISEHYTISYSYDIGLSTLRQVSQGSHEININYNLNKRIGIGLPPDIIYNPRNL